MVSRRRRDDVMRTGIPGLGQTTLFEQCIEDMIRAINPEMDEVKRDAERCTASLETYVRSAWRILEPATPLVWGWHLGCLCEHLQACTTRQLRNLVINMPPRHMKSLAVCVFWFTWEWAQRPASRWLFSSYSDSLSTRDSRKCQDLIRHPWYQERWGDRFRLRTNERAMGKFTNDRTGHRIATSVMGRGMGEGGDYVIVDDPHKPGETHSDILRERVNHWWSETMSTRGNDPKTVVKIIVMQRLHERDLSGHVLSRDLGYEHLCMPAEYEPKRYFFSVADSMRDNETRVRDAIVLTKLQRERPELRDPRREEGELLWPERFDNEEIDKLRKELEAFGWSGQGLQRPSPEEGDIFNRGSFQRATDEVVEGQEPVWLLHHGEEGTPPYRVRKRDCRIFQTCDTALTKGTKSSYSACCTWALAPVYQMVRKKRKLIRRCLLLLDVWRERLSVPEQFDKLMELREPWTDPPLLFQAVEKKASGIGLIQQAVAEGKVMIGLSPGSDDKVVRSATMASLYKQGSVWHRQSMSKLAVFEEEMLSFPSGARDDLVDCASYAGILFQKDKLVNMGVDRELLVYPTSEDVDGDPSISVNGDGNRFMVGEHEVVFPSDENEWGR